MPCTRKARRIPKSPPKKALPGITALRNQTTRNIYVEAIDKNLAHVKNHHICPTEMSRNIIDTINTVVTETLPTKSNLTLDNQLWKNDV